LSHLRLPPPRGGKATHQHQTLVPR
jgi:hypothetical protein